MHQGQRQPYKDGAGRMTPVNGGSAQAAASANHSKPVRTPFHLWWTLFMRRLQPHKVVAFPQGVQACWLTDMRDTCNALEIASCAGTRVTFNRVFSRQWSGTHYPAEQCQIIGGLT